MPPFFSDASINAKMDLESRVLEPGLSSVVYGPEDIILVVDTSFLSALSNRHLWAYQSILMLERIASSRNAKWGWRAPIRISEQYNKFFLEGTLEEGTNNRLAPLSINEILGANEKMEFSFEHYTPELSREIWKDSHEGRKQANKHPNSRKRRKAGNADLDVIMFALGIAQSGADVYVASSDFKDVIRPLSSKAQYFADRGWRITLLYPSQIDLQYWSLRGQELPVKATLTGKVISDMQDIEESSSSHHVVIFEKNVHSGNATFDTGVGIAKKEYFRQFNLPEEYSPICENYRLIPAVKVGSLRDEKDRKKVAQASKRLNALQLIVIEESQPQSPTLIIASRYIRNLPLYRADLDFLYWQSNSEFAKSAYTPFFMRTAAS